MGVELIVEVDVSSGYLCLNYKCIKEQSSSGGGGGGGGSSGGSDYDTNPTCTDTCSSLGHECGSVCGVNCGTCSTGYTCAANRTCIRDVVCIPTTCSALSRTCGTAYNGCGGTLNCGTCSTGYTCAGNGTCVDSGSCTCESMGYECGNRNICGVMTHCGNCGIGEDCNENYQCVIGTCNDDSISLGYQCGYQYICGLNITCAGCSYGLNCVNNVCVPPTACRDTCSSLSYGCGIHNICGENVDCGNCGTGEICNDNNLCIYSTCENGRKDGTETGVDCGGICLDCVLEPIAGVRDIFYVAPWGDDSNPGTFSQPWKTWDKAFAWDNGVGPGDVVYFRGGVYYRNSTSIIYFYKYGTPDMPLMYLAYPGERPILDGHYMNRSLKTWIYLMEFEIHYSGTTPPSNLYFKGLEMRNFYDIEGGYSVGIWVSKGENITFKNIVYNNGGNEGLALGQGSTNISIINCDFYNNFDYYNSPYTALLVFGDNGNGLVGHRYSGGSSRGFTVGSRNDFSAHFHVEGTRSWNNSDGGFGTPGEESLIFKNNWIFLNGYGLGDGDGWKGSYIDYNDAQSTDYIHDVRKNFSDVITAWNRVGFDDNKELARWRVNNLFVYHNGYQWPRFYLTGGINFCRSTKAPGDLLYNNIEYDNAPMNRDGSGGSNCFSSDLIHSNNTWDSSLNVSDNDFINLDINQLMRPRKANGSLPDVEFGKLKQGSDLIDAGRVVVGYHCSTSGPHPGENCKEWFGSAPDLGPFESNY